MTGLIGVTPYETWVVTLRAWSDDPQTPLQHLPVLREDMYTPDTFSRLAAELTKAMQAVSDRWHDGLARAWEHAQTPHDLAREMVSLRGTLSRRGQLASHPALPETIRAALTNGFRKDVENWQAELEDAVRRQHSRSTVNTDFVNTMLGVVRANSLVAVLAYEHSPARDRPGLVPLPERDKRAPLRAPISAAGRRRIVPFPRAEKS